MLHFKIECVENKSIQGITISETDLLCLIRILYTNQRSVRLGKEFIQIYEQLPNAYEELKKVLP